MEKLMLRERIALKLGFVKDERYEKVYAKTFTIAGRTIAKLIWAPGRPWKEMGAFKHEYKYGIGGE